MKEVVGGIRERIGGDPYARSMGIELLELRPGYSKVAMTLQPHMVNFHGMPHGGVIFSLADYAFAAACNSHGQTAVAMNVNISFLAAVAVGQRLVAEGVEVKRGRRSSFCQMTVRTAEGEVVAQCQAVAHRMEQTFAAPP